jgi:hypothetical protein
MVLSLRMENYIQNSHEKWNVFIILINNNFNDLWIIKHGKMYVAAALSEVDNMSLFAYPYHFLLLPATLQLYPLE